MLRAVKVPTTADVTGGIVAAMRGVLADGGERVDAVMIGTTHFINAVVQRRSLAQVAVLRIALPATAGLPPFTDWPDDLAECTNGGAFLVEGGHDYDGRRFMPLDVAAVRAAAREMRARGVSQAAVTAMFSPLDRRGRGAGRRDPARGGARTLRHLSHMLGGIGLLERENAALLNAALIPLAQQTISGFLQAMQDAGIAAPLFITQNDGTVATAAQAVRFPGVELCLRPDQLDARRRLPVAACRTRWWWMSAAPPTDFGHVQAAFRARPTPWCRSAACARCSACPTCCRSAWAAAAWSIPTTARNRPAQRRLSPDRTGAGVRRRP